MIALQRCPVCGYERRNPFRLNHVHDGAVVPFDHADGPPVLDVSGRFGQPTEPEPAPVKRGPGRPRKNPVG